MSTLPVEFEKWWKQTKNLSEFTGVSEAAALALWQRAGGKVEVKKEEEAETLPEDFQRFWENATHLAEFRGCTMAAAYAAFLAGKEATKTPIAEKLKGSKKTAKQVESLPVVSDDTTGA